MTTFLLDSPFAFECYQRTNQTFDLMMINLWINIFFSLFKNALSLFNLEFCCNDWHCKEAGRLLYDTYGCVRKNINVSAGQLQYMEHILCMMKLSKQDFYYLRHALGSEACKAMVLTAVEFIVKWKESMHSHFTRYDRIVPHYLTNRLKTEEVLFSKTVLLCSLPHASYYLDIMPLPRKTDIAENARLVFYLPSNLPSWIAAYL